MTQNTEKLELSHSSIETFKTCKRKWYYNYILKMPKKHWTWFVFGNFVHLVFEKFYRYIIYYKKRNLAYTNKELMKRAYISAVKKYHRLAFTTDLPELTETQKTDCQKIIKKYLARPNLSTAEVLFVEKPFYIEVNEFLSIKGYIDRIDKINEDHYKVVDYKTSKTSVGVDKTYQTALYSAALKRILGRTDVKLRITRILDFLKIEKETKGEYDHGKEDKMFAEMIEVAKQIRTMKENGKDEDWKATENDFCWCCDFANACASDVKQNPKIFIPATKK